MGKIPSSCITSPSDLNGRYVLVARRDIPNIKVENVGSRFARIIDSEK
jgi:hypothetical protein